MPIHYRAIVEEMKAYLRVLRRRRAMPETKFVIFSRGRSGSTLLTDLLDSHPQIHCEGELFRHRLLCPRLYLKAKSVLSDADAYGFKLLSYQIWKVQPIRRPTRFVDELHSRGYKVVYLRRKNILRHALSNLYARHSGAFAHRSSGDGVNQEKMSVDLDELVRWMQSSERLAAFEQQALKRVPHLDLCYEDDLQQTHTQQAAVDRVVDYLGLPVADVRTDLIKITPSTISGFVENDAELVRFIASSRYAKHLEDGQQDIGIHDSTPPQIP